MDIFKIAAGSIARHILSGVGGALVSIGIADSAVKGFTAASEPIIAGLLVWGIGQVWSLVQKAKAK